MSRMLFPVTSSIVRLGMTAMQAGNSVSLLPNALTSLRPSILQSSAGSDAISFSDTSSLLKDRSDDTSTGKNRKPLEDTSSASRWDKQPISVGSASKEFCERTSSRSSESSLMRGETEFKLDSVILRDFNCLAEKNSSGMSCNRTFEISISVANVNSGSWQSFRRPSARQATRT